MRKVSNVNTGLSQVHGTPQQLESKTQTKHLKQVLSELESIKVHDEKSATDNEEYESISEESSGEESEEDGRESTSDSEENLVNTTPEKDEEMDDLMSSPPPKLLEKQKADEDEVQETTEPSTDEGMETTEPSTSTTWMTTLEETTTEEPPLTTEATEATTTTEEPSTSTTPTTTTELREEEEETTATPTVIPADVPLLSRTPKDDRLYETVVVVKNKKPNRRVSHKTSPRNPFTRGGFSNRSWRLPAPPQKPPRSLIQLNEEEQFPEETSNAVRRPTYDEFKDGSTHVNEPGVDRYPQAFRLASLYRSRVIKKNNGSICMRVTFR